MTLTRTHKILVLIALYLAQGLPYGFFTQALPVLMRDAGYSLKAISAAGLLYLPWALKFLWAPYVDQRGTHRAWLLTLQICSVTAALLLAGIDTSRGLAVVLVATLVFNLIAATQDVATDALAVRLLDSRERGLANAIQVGAYRVGMILGGGVLLWIFARTNWSTMFFCMAALLALTVLPVVGLPSVARETTSKPHTALLLGWLARLRRPGMATIIALILCYRFGDAMLSKQLTPFMRDWKLSLETIAIMKGIVGSATSLVGALIGGWFAFHVGRRTALLVSGLLQAGSFLLYLLVALKLAGVHVLWVATVFEGLVGTMATVALFTLMMDVAEPEHAGTDYTLLASAVVLFDGVGAFVGAAIADATSYATTFSIGTVLAAAGCVFVVFHLDRVTISERVTHAWRGSRVASA
ncbi:MAG: MFS transporter [Steroidobacteraceae bacterium]